MWGSWIGLTASGTRPRRCDHGIAGRFGGRPTLVAFRIHPVDLVDPIRSIELGREPGGVGEIE